MLPLKKACQRRSAAPLSSSDSEMLTGKSCPRWLKLQSRVEIFRIFSFFVDGHCETFGDRLFQKFEMATLTLQLIRNYGWTLFTISASNLLHTTGFEPSAFDLHRGVAKCAIVQDLCQLSSIDFIVLSSISRSYSGPSVSKS